MAGNIKFGFAECGSLGMLNLVFLSGTSWNTDFNIYECGRLKMLNLVSLSVDVRES